MTETTADAGRSRTVGEADGAGVVSRMWDDDRCWCRAVECDDPRHCSCGLTGCVGHSTVER